MQEGENAFNMPNLLNTTAETCSEHNIPQMLAIQWHSVEYWFFYPHDCVAEWELLLAATAQHHFRVLYGIITSMRKIKIQSAICTEFVLNAYCFYTILKLKKVSQTIVKSETIYAFISALKNGHLADTKHSKSLGYVS